MHSLVQVDKSGRNAQLQNPNNLNDKNLSPRFDLKNNKQNTSYLYTPTQHLISNFLTSKKQIEDDLIKTLKGISLLKPQNNTHQITRQQINYNLLSRRSQLQGIKRKISKSCQQQMQIYEVIKKRIHRHENYQRDQNKISVKHNKIRKIKADFIDDSMNTDGNQQSQMISQQYERQISQNRKRRQQFQLNKQVAYFMLQDSLERQCKNTQLIRQQKAYIVKFEIGSTQLKDQIVESNNYQDDNLASNILAKQNKQTISTFINYHDILSVQKDVYGQFSQQQASYLGELFLQTQYPVADIDKISSIKQVYKSRNKQYKFYQNEFISAIESSTIKSDPSKIDSFKGQIQIQCMLLRRKYTIAQDILLNDLKSVDQFVYQNSHMIKKHQSHLEFWIVICRAIGLIKTKEIANQLKAIELIRNKISKSKGQIENWQRQELSKITSMLLLQQSLIKIGTYLQKTAKSFKQVFQQIYKLPDGSKFLHSIYTGSLVIRTPQCISQQKQNPLLCPLCNILVQECFNQCPLLLTRSQSNLICRITNKLMDHENYPVILPSNQIYSLNGLEQTKKLIKMNNGQVAEKYYCLITNTQYNKEQARKVFLA